MRFWPAHGYKRGTRRIPRCGNVVSLKRCDTAGECKVPRWASSIGHSRHDWPVAPLVARKFFCQKMILACGYLGRPTSPCFPSGARAPSLQRALAGSSRSRRSIPQQPRCQRRWRERRRSPRLPTTARLPTSPSARAARRAAAAGQSSSTGHPPGARPSPPIMS